MARSFRILAGPLYSFRFVSFRLEFNDDLIQKKVKVKEKMVVITKTKEKKPCHWICKDDDK